MHFGLLDVTFVFVKVKYDVYLLTHLPCLWIKNVDCIVFSSNAGAVSFKSSAAQISSFYLWWDLGKLGRGVKRWQWWPGLTGSGLVNTRPPTSLPHLPHHSQADVMQLAIVVAPCNLSPTIMLEAIMAQYHLKVAGNPPIPVNCKYWFIFNKSRSPQYEDMCLMRVEWAPIIRSTLGGCLHCLAPQAVRALYF